MAGRPARSGAGLVILVCAMRGDGEAEADWLARKAVNLRIFRDDEGRMNRSLIDVGGSALIVSQFTLAAETKGNRPGFSTAAAPEDGRRLYERFVGRGRRPRGAGGDRRLRSGDGGDAGQRRPGDDLARQRRTLTAGRACAPHPALR